METGNLDAEKVPNSIKALEPAACPSVLPFTFKGQLAMMKQDFDGAGTEHEESTTRGAHERSKGQPVADGHDRFGRKQFQTG